MEFETVQERVYTAIARLLENDAYLLKVNVNEQSITHWLAVYLQEQFEDWDVDCEYNRNRTDKKTLRLCEDGEGMPDCIDLPVEELGRVEPDDTEGKSVFPDIIVHRRGTGDNSLVIEAKKTSSRVGNGFDHKKLSLYREQLGYRYGLFLRFAVHRESSVALDHWFMNED